MFHLMEFFSQEGWWLMAGEDGHPKSRTESEFVLLCFLVHFITISIYF